MLKGVELTKADVLPSHVLAIDPGTAQRGLIHGVATKEPAFGLPALWVPEATREQAQLAGYTVVDASSAIATHLSEIIKRHGHELLGRQEVHQPSPHICLRSLNVMGMNYWAGKRCNRCSTNWRKFTPNWLKN
jgi:flagellar biosynthesis component FlhA